MLDNCSFVYLFKKKKKTQTTSTSQMSEAMSFFKENDIKDKHVANTNDRQQTY